MLVDMYCDKLIQSTYSKAEYPFVVEQAVQSFTASGWQLRPKYSFFAGGLAGLFVLILGIGILYLLLKKRRRTGSPERGVEKARLIIGGIAWGLLVLSLSTMVLLGSWAGTSDQERVLTDAVPDPFTGIKYVYLAEEKDYGGISYYRSPDFIFMEEWSEAKDYDTEAGNDLPGNCTGEGLYGRGWRDRTA